MSSYCLKCRKNTESENPNVEKTNNGRMMLLSNCVVFHRKKRDLLQRKNLAE